MGEGKQHVLFEATVRFATRNHRMDVCMPVGWHATCLGKTEPVHHPASTNLVTTREDVDDCKNDVIVAKQNAALNPVGTARKA